MAQMGICASVSRVKSGFPYFKILFVLCWARKGKSSSLLKIKTTSQNSPLTI